MILGLTGGIASGKSSVVEIFKELGVDIIDSDKISHEVSLERDVISQIQEAFGEEVITEEGTLHRGKLRERVFKNRGDVGRLNAILHPKIKKRVLDELEKMKNRPLIVLDIPLLYEVKWENLCDKILVIYVDRETQVKRVMKRDGVTRESAERVIENQMSLEKKRELADFVVENSGSLEELKNDILALYEKLKDEN